MLIMPDETDRSRSKALFDKIVGQKFRKKAYGKQQTRLVVDVTLGCDVIFAYGPRLAYRGQVTEAEWLWWQRGARRVK